MKLNLIVIIALSTSLVGCMGHKYGRIVPVDPKPTGFASHTAVDSLRPTLQWRDKTGTPSIRYDVGVWNMVATGYGMATQLLPGEQVYLRENIEGQTHTLEESLRPETYYMWSVREHATTNWASGLTWHNAGTYGFSKSTELFIFRTRKQ